MSDRGIKMKTYRLSFILLCGLVLQNFSVQAEEPSINARDLLFASERVSLEELDEQRGREGLSVTAMNNSNMRATLYDGVAINNDTGFNSIDNGAFSMSSGITTVFQNSGNNNILQNITNINVTIVP